MLISILTVCYNSEQTIEDAILSVEKQSYKNIEHIFIDGMSTDSTAKIIKDCCSHEYKMLVERDQGIYDAINKGILLCNGEYILLLHSDDVLDNAFVIEKAVQYIKSCEFPDLVCGSVSHVNEIYDTDKSYLYESIGFKRWKLIFGFIPAHNGTFVKKSVYRVFTYNTSFKSAGDFDWFVRVFSSKHLKWRLIPLVITQQRLGGMSTNGISSVVRTTNEMVRASRLPPILSYVLFSIRLPIKLYQRKIRLYLGRKN